MRTTLNIDDEALSALVKVLVDTSAWVEFLNGTGSPEALAVDRLLAIATCDSFFRVAFSLCPPGLDPLRQLRVALSTRWTKER